MQRKTIEEERRRNNDQISDVYDLFICRVKKVKKNIQEKIKRRPGETYTLEIFSEDDWECCELR